MAPELKIPKSETPLTLQKKAVALKTQGLICFAWSLCRHCLFGPSMIEPHAVK